VALLLFAAAAVGCTDPGSRGFDTGTNGIWVGHKWYSGREVRSGAPVDPAEIAPLVVRLRAARIRYLYVHVGPARSDGFVEDSAAPLFSELKRAYPEGVFLAWLGARVEKVELDSAEWRANVVTQNEHLRAEGFDGVHFNLEPLRDAEPGYLDLLAEVRTRMGGSWLISQATPRSAVFGIPLGSWRGSWSAAFYRSTMHFSDQTVLMAYDSNLPFQWAYVAFVSDQTRRLTRWACEAVDHELLIGIPTYQDHPLDPSSEIETVPNAARGVRSGLATFSQRPRCFAGVSLYSNWVTDDSEWSEFERHWLNPVPD